MLKWKELFMSLNLLSLAAKGPQKIVILKWELLNVLVTAAEGTQKVVILKWKFLNLLVTAVEGTRKIVILKWVRNPHLILPHIFLLVWFNCSWFIAYSLWQMKMNILTGYLMAGLWTWKPERVVSISEDHTRLFHVSFAIICVFVLLSYEKEKKLKLKKGKKEKRNMYYHLLCYFSVYHLCYLHFKSRPFPFYPLLCFPGEVSVDVGCCLTTINMYLLSPLTLCHLSTIGDSSLSQNVGDSLWCALHATRWFDIYYEVNAWKLLEGYLDFIFK